ACNYREDGDYCVQHTERSDLCGRDQQEEDLQKEVDGGNPPGYSPYYAVLRRVPRCQPEEDKRSNRRGEGHYNTDALLRMSDLSRPLMSSPFHGNHLPLLQLVLCSAPLLHQTFPL